eukprot:XP_024448191.1 uncharacterized protein LOC112325619 [Populus trichocarpa]
MVRTRQGTRTEPPSLERRGGNQGAQGWQDEDPLDDTTSHAPIIPPETLQGEAAVAGEGQRPNQTEGVPLVAAEQQERSEAQPSTIPTGVPPQYVDAGLLVQIVKAVMEGMTGSATQTTPTTQIPQAAPMTSMTTDNVVPLVRLVKSMREMGCELAMTWWETVQLKRATETLTWSDFKTEFENQFYSKYHRKVKEQEFLALRQEEHMIEKLRDGLRQDLRQGLIALRFKSVRELIEAAQALEACIGESQGGYQGISKKRDGDYFSGRPPLSKKGKSGVFEQYGKKREFDITAPSTVKWESDVSPGRTLCAEERVIGGGTASIWVKGVIIVVEEVITRGTAPKGTLDSRGRPRAQNDRTSGRDFHLTQEEVRAASDVVAGTLLMNNFNVHVLFDPGATHSFIAKRIVTKLRKGVEIVEKGFVIGTPMRNMIETNIVYVDVGVSLSGYETEVDLIPLELHDFDIILGMNWLSKYKALIDCYAKTVTFQTPGCMGYLAYILNSDDKGPRLKDIHVVKEFPDVFLEELPGLPPEREVEVSIDTFPKVPPIAQQPYRMAPAELNELKTQL